MIVNLLIEDLDILMKLKKKYSINMSKFIVKYYYYTKHSHELSIKTKHDYTLKIKRLYIKLDNNEREFILEIEKDKNLMPTIIFLELQKEEERIKMEMKQEEERINKLKILEMKNELKKINSILHDINMETKCIKSFNSYQRKK